MGIVFNRSKYRTAAIAIVLGALAPSVGAQAAAVTIGSVAALYRPGSIKTGAQAAQALQDATAERTLVEARFAEDERICYPKFFATACLDQVTERRRHALAQLRPVEVEAGRTQRLLTALEHDAAIAERERQEAQDAPLRAGREQQHIASQAARAAAPRPDADPQAIAKAEADFARRQAEHALKLQDVARRDAARAQAAPANIAAYDKKQRDAEAHQQDVINKKAEKLARQAREDEQKAKQAQAAATPK